MPSRVRVLPAGLKQLTPSELNDLSKDCNINATLHTFMRLFTDESGRALRPGPSEEELFTRMRAQGYTNLSRGGIKQFIDKVAKYGIIKKVVTRVSSDGFFFAV